MEMEPAHPGCGRKIIQTWHLFCFFNQPASSRNSRSLTFGYARLARPAALARPKSGPFGVSAGVMETDILAKGKARRTGRPAIDPGRPHGIPKHPVRRAVAAYYRLPTLLVTRETRHQGSHNGAPITSLGMINLPGTPILA